MVVPTCARISTGDLSEPSPQDIEFLVRYLKFERSVRVLCYYLILMTPLPALGAHLAELIRDQATDLRVRATALCYAVQDNGEAVKVLEQDLHDLRRDVLLDYAFFYGNRLRRLRDSSAIDTEFPRSLELKDFLSGQQRYWRYVPSWIMGEVREFCECAD